MRAVDERAPHPSRAMPERCDGGEPLSSESRDRPGPDRLRAEVCDRAGLDDPPPTRPLASSTACSADPGARSQPRTLSTKKQGILPSGPWVGGSPSGRYLEPASTRGSSGPIPNRHQPNRRPAEPPRGRAPQGSLPAARALLGPAGWSLEAPPWSKRRTGGPATLSTMPASAAPPTCRGVGEPLTWSPSVPESLHSHRGSHRTRSVEGVPTATSRARLPAGPPPGRRESSSVSEALHGRARASCKAADLPISPRRLPCPTFLMSNPDIR